MSAGLAETAVAAKTKKLTYEQAWEACKKEMDKMGVFWNVHSVERAPYARRRLHEKVRS
jgi:hypothetical protein